MDEPLSKQLHLHGHTRPPTQPLIGHVRALDFFFPCTNRIEWTVKRYLLNSPKRFDDCTLKSAMYSGFILHHSVTDISISIKVFFWVGVNKHDTGISHSALRVCGFVRNVKRPPEENDLICKHVQQGRPFPLWVQADLRVPEKEREDRKIIKRKKKGRKKRTPAQLHTHVNRSSSAWDRTWFVLHISMPSS